MKCPKCGYIGEGKFCSQCGTPMVEEEMQEDELFRRVAAGLADSVQDDDDVPYDEDSYGDRYDEDYDDDYDDRSGSERAADRLADWGRSAGEAVGKGVHRVWDFLCMLLRFLCAGLMAVSAVYMAWVFLGEIRSVGQIREIFRGGRAIQTYVGIALVLMGFALIQILWILKKSRRHWKVKHDKIDKGHGIFAFLLYTVCVLAAGAVTVILPERDGVLEGVRAIFRGFQLMGNPFLMINGLGLIFSILRKLCGSL